MKSISEGVARRQSSPDTGKSSARPAGKPGAYFTFWRICDDSFPATPHPPQAKPARPDCVFGGMAESIGPMGFKTQTTFHPSWGAASRWSAPVPGKGRDGRNYAPCSSSAMSSGRLFLDRGRGRDGHC